MEPARPLVYDVTHLVTRLTGLASSGIDMVDVSYGVHFSAGASRLAAGVHYGLFRPHVLSPDQVRVVVDAAARRWREDVGDPNFAQALNWLASTPGAPFPGKWRPTRLSSIESRAARFLQSARFRILQNRGLAIPHRAIYLNVAQHLYEYPVFFRWLNSREDICKVFMIHDLLPLELPEYFVRGKLGVFGRRLDTALAYADAFITSTETVRVRLREELARRNLRERPIHVQPFAAPLQGLAGAAPSQPPADGHPYFLMIGTIEPRKNHLFLLALWRALASENPNAPRLVLVGERGWECEQITSMIDRSPALRNHVLELSGLPSGDLLRLLQGARALLLPSFGEGYGLPIVEALSVGTPVIASDIPAFREVAGGGATLLSPLDGPAWRNEIVRLSSETRWRGDQSASAKLYGPPTWETYFAGVEAFLSTL